MLTSSNQPRLGARAGGGEEYNVVTQIAERVAKVCDDPLCATVKLRRYVLIEWRDLCDFHRDLL